MPNLYENLDLNTIFERLLTNGLFSEDFNGIFSSKNFGDLVLKDENNSAFKIGNIKFDIITFNKIRNNNVHRIIGIPHPLAYIDLCKNLKKYWNKIEKVIGDNNQNYLDTSMIIPVDNDRISGEVGYLELFRERIGFHTVVNRDFEVDKKLEKQIGNKYYVFADISNYYNSIYSHSIGWALVGKKHAKTNRSASEWFNMIDKSSRDIKNNETNGIPIGPDTSLILSEIILSQIDRELATKKGYKYLRYIDDFHAYFYSKEQAEKFIKDLEKELSKFKLLLNAKKTKILEMPEPFYDDWISEINSLNIENGINDFNNIKTYIDKGLSLSIKEKKYTPLNYLLKEIYKKRIDNFEVYKKTTIYIFNLVINIPYINNNLVNFINYGFENYSKDDMQFINNSINILINEYIENFNGDILLKLISICVKYDIEIIDYENIKKKIVKDNDCLSLVLLFVYSIKNEIDLEYFYNLLPKIDEKENWLFVYELYKNDKNNFLLKKSSFKYSNFYEYLESKDITFISSDLSNFEFINFEVEDLPF